MLSLLWIQLGFRGFVIIRKRIFSRHFLTYFHHWRRLRQKRRQGDVLEYHTSHLAARMIGRKVFGRTSILGGLVWCELEGHLFFWSIYSDKCPFFYWSISSNHPGESIPSHKQQRRPLPYLSSVLFFFYHFHITCEWEHFLIFLDFLSKEARAVSK